MITIQECFRRIQNGVTTNQTIVPARIIILLVSGLMPLFAQIIDEIRVAASARNEIVASIGFMG